MSALALAGWALFTPATGWAKLPSSDQPDKAPAPLVVAKAPPQLEPVDSTTLDPVVLRAIDELAVDGLPDPRRGEYREIEIAESPTWKLKVHGWVLPADGAQRHAIGWNGVIYPLASVGAPIDLRKEIAALTPGGARRFQGYGMGWPLNDSTTLRPELSLPLQVALLVRLGEMKLAVEAWNAGYSDAPAMKTKDPFPGMADFWLNCRFNQAISAYMNGDYATCVKICRDVAAARKKVEVGIARRKIDGPWPLQSVNQLLWQLPVLEADAERRQHETPFTPVLESGQPAAGPDRITALVRDLELVAVQQEMNPGQTDPIDDPVVQELVKQGHAAVEPLIRCLATDNRLTKSRFTAGMGFEGAIIPVYEAAYVALDSILNPSIPLFEPVEFDSMRQRAPRNLSAADRQALAAKFEAAWQKVKGRSDTDFAYTTLQDDKAGAVEWFKAIDAIVQPADGTFTGYRLVPVGGAYSLHQGDGPFPARGDVLRAKTNPSVTDLIIRRFEQLVQDNTDTKLDLTQLDKVLFALVDWDGKNHLADLRRLGAELDARVQRQNGKSDQGVNVTLCLRRMQLGDASALQDYTAWIVKQPRQDLNKDSFLIMWRNPTSPLVRQAAEKLFADPVHSWRPATNEYGSVINLLMTPMLGLPAFRQSVEDALEDKSLIGKVKAYDNGNFSIQFTGVAQEENYTPPEELPRPLNPFASTDVRLCDYYAYLLSKVDGFPCCALYWSEKRRDAAVATCRDFLQHDGDNFAYRPGDTDTAVPGGGAVSIHVPILDHPATPEDVAHGRAIFSLPGTTRLCHLPNLPLSCWRPSRKMDPSHGVTSYPDGTSKPVILYTTLGKIWQAEEQLVDGKWQRYFGFVGRYQFEKVPAEEILFSEGGFTKVTPEIGGDLDAPFEYDRGHFSFSFGTRQFLPLSAPIHVTVSITNYSDLDRSVPRELLLPPKAARSLPPAVFLTLQYSAKMPPRVQPFSNPPFVYGPWQDIPPRPEVKIAATVSAEPVLAPAQKLTLLDIDLRDYFDLTREGAYKLTAVFHTPGQPVAKTRESIFLVSDKPN